MESSKFLDNQRVSQLLWLLFLLFGGQRIVEPVDLVGHQIVQNDAVAVDEGGAGLAAGLLALATPILDGQCEQVLIVVLLHIGAGLPDARQFGAGILLQSDDKGALLAERCVEREHAHQGKVGQHAEEQHGPRLRKRMGKVPGMRHNGHTNGQGAEHQTGVNQAELFLQLWPIAQQAGLDRIVQGMLHRRAIPLVDFNQLQIVKLLLDLVYIRDVAD